MSAFDPQAAQFQKHLLVKDLNDIILDSQIKWKKEATVVLNFEPHTVDLYVYYDHFMLTTLITNLVENGLKYNVSEYKRVQVNVLYISPKSLMIEIGDNGFGIDKQDRSRIFNKFQRGRQIRSSTGLGLGLYFVYNIVAVHKWKLDLETFQDQGTIFRIIIPISK